MKKIFIAAIAVLTLAACQKNFNAETPEQHLSLNLSINKAGAINNAGDTKAVKTAWETGDIIIAVFDLDYTDDKHLELTYNGTSWDAVWSAGLEDVLISRGSGKVSAVFVPNAVSYEDAGTDTGRRAYRPKDSNGNYIYSYSLKIDGASYSISGSVLTATLDMTLNTNEGAITHFFIDGLSGTGYTLSTDGDKLYAYCFGTFLVDGDHTKVMASYFTANIPGYPIGTGIEFSAQPSVGSAVEYLFTLTDTSTGKKYQYNAGTKTLNGGESIVLPSLSAWTPLS